MQETANKQKRITLKTLHEMLDGMSVELAEKVHLLFMANYIDYSDYEFRDENQVESSQMLDVVRIDEVDNRCLWSRLCFVVKGWLKIMTK